MWHSAQWYTSGVLGQSSPPKEIHPKGTKAQTWERRSKTAALRAYSALSGREERQETGHFINICGTDRVHA